MLSEAVLTAVLIGLVLLLVLDSRETYVYGTGIFRAVISRGDKTGKAEYEKRDRVRVQTLGE